MKHTFGVIGAMASEVQNLIGQMKNAKAETVLGLTFHCGSIGENAVILVQSGIGKVSAARCAQILIDRYAPDYLINTGIGGGVGEGLHVGDVVIGSELVQHDFDLSGFGTYVPGYISGFGDGKSPSVFRSDEGLKQAFLRTVYTFLPRERVHEGRIATGDQFIAGAAEKARLRERFSALVAEMEGGAIAQTAVMSGVPFIVVRVISDLADGTAAASFDAFEQETADLSARVIEACVRSF